MQVNNWKSPYTVLIFLLKTPSTYDSGIRELQTQRSICKKQIGIASNLPFCMPTAPAMLMGDIDPYQVMSISQNASICFKFPGFCWFDSAIKLFKRTFPLLNKKTNNYAVAVLIYLQTSFASRLVIIYLFEDIC